MLTLCTQEKSIRGNICTEVGVPRKIWSICEKFIFSITKCKFQGILDHLEVRAKEAALNLTTAEIDSIMEHTHNVLGRIIDAEGGHVRQ